VPGVGFVRVALVPTASYGGADRASARSDAEADAARLVEDLQLQSCEVTKQCFVCTSLRLKFGLFFDVCVLELSPIIFWDIFISKNFIVGVALPVCDPNFYSQSYAKILVAVDCRAGLLRRRSPRIARENGKHRPPRHLGNKTLYSCNARTNDPPH